MSEAEETVKVKLVLSNSPDELAKTMSDALGKASETASKASTASSGKGWQGMFSANANADALGGSFKALGSMGMHAMSAVGSAAGVAAAVGIAAVTASLFAASTKAEKLKETTLAMMSVSGKANMSFGDAKVMADAYDAQFRRVAMSAGATRDDVQAAFMTVADGLRNTYRKRLTRAQAEAITESMAQSAKVVPGGLAKLTAEYEQMKTGQFSSSGALVGMISATKVLKGTTVEVARQMAMMTDVNRMTIAEEAMRRMAKQAKSIPLGFEGLKSSLGEIYNLASVSLGEPLVSELLPVLNTVKDWFVENATSIELAARGIGKQIGSFVGGVSSIVASFYRVFSQDAGKLGDYIKGAFDYAKDAFKWIVDNAEPIAKTFRDVFNVVIDALEKAAAALLGVHQGELRAMAGGPQAAAGASGKRAYEIAAVEQGMKKRGNSNFMEGASAPEGGSEAHALLQKARANIGAIKGLTEEMIAGGDAATGSTEKFIGMYKAATDAHNDGLSSFLLSTVSGNQTLQAALIAQGGEVKAGLEAFAKDVGDAKFLDEVRKSIRGDGAGKVLAPQVNFNGNTFNIKQDFRDQDPDRVMFAFERDLTRAASNRSQSKLGMSGLAFGT